MKLFAFALICTISYMSCFSQDSTKSRSLYIATNFSMVPVIKITGTDTGYHNALSISPSLNFRSKNGWGIRYSPSIITSGTNPGIYMHTISAGYRNKGNKSMDLSFTYSHFFISKNADIPYTPIHNELYLSLGYTKKWLQPLFSSSIGFGRSLEASSSIPYDISLSGGVSHEFGWEDKGLFSYIGFSPSLLLNAGTNEYFSFLCASRYLSHTTKFDSYVLKGTKEKSSIASPSPKLDFRNIELDLETTVRARSFSITPSGAIFFPVSGLYRSIDGFWQISLKYDLKHA